MFAKPTLTVVLVLALAGCGSGEESPSAAASGGTASSAGPGAAGEPPGPAASGAAEVGGPQLTDEALQVHTTASGLTEPTGIAFISAQEFFVIEKSTGEVHRVADGQIGEPVLDLAVNYFDERGLLGIAVHPEFEANPFVYLYWTASGEGTGEGGMLGEDTDEERGLPDLGNRVDRFAWDGTALTWDRNIVQMRSNTLETDTLDRIRGNHDGGSLAFGLDGTLYIVNGDQNLRGQLQNLPDGPAPDDANFTGVVLRYNADGSIPEDNPFYALGAEMGDEVGENLQAVWAYGVRNSFGLAVHPESGALWQTENGDDSWDEVNVFPAGANSGWIKLIGPPERFDEYREIETTSEDGLDNPEFDPNSLPETSDESAATMFELDGSQFVPPVFSWKYPVAVTSIGFATGDALGESSANTAWLGTVLTDSLYRYPVAEDGASLAFEGDAGLTDLVDDNAEKGDIGESADYVVGTGFGIVTHILPAPDGSLFVVSLSAGEVYRVSAAGSEPGPTVVPAPAASGGTAGEGEVVELTIGTDEGAELLFDPTEASVPAGATVRLTFVNESTVPHNLTFGDPINAATSVIVDPGAQETIEFTAPEPGDYTFVCTLHPGMEGVLTVE